MSTDLLFFNEPATTEIYTLSLHDALPIWVSDRPAVLRSARLSCLWMHPVSSRKNHTRRWAGTPRILANWCIRTAGSRRSEEHTSELQSRQYLVCRLLLEKKKISQEEVSEA